MSAVFFFVLCNCILVATEVSGLIPLELSIDTVTAKCGGEFDPKLDGQIVQTLMQAQQQLKPPGCNPPKNGSCREIFYCFPSASSGYYQVHTPNSSISRVYCDMTGNNCGGTRGWTRVTYVNMLQPNTTCPQGLTQKVLSGKTLCGRSNSKSGGCQSANFPSLGLKYSQVSGQLRGYQWGTPNAFGRVGTVNADRYVDGAIVTCTSEHIWTYANGMSLSYSSDPRLICPCNINGNATIVPSFVGNDYYCETGNNMDSLVYHFSPNDPLWDGQQCVGAEAPCCAHPNMPWFTKKLSDPTTSDIEVRLCQDQDTANEDTLLQVIELYVY